MFYRDHILNESIFDRFKKKDNKVYTKPETKLATEESIKQIKDRYGLTIQPTTTKYTDEKHLISDIKKDCKLWANKTASSKYFEDKVKKYKEDEYNREDWKYEYGNEPINKNTVKKNLDITCEYEGYISIYYGPQNLIIYCGCHDDIAIMVELKYGDYVKNVSFGDGDEGCVYFDIRPESLSA